MTDLKTPIAFTGNRLNDGIAVWLGSNGRWVESVELAATAHTLEEKETLQTVAEQADADNIIIEPYEIEVTVFAGVLTPIKFRERIRAAGPTVRLDLGKQSERAARAA